jgi:hypothetical protein
MNLKDLKTHTTHPLKPVFEPYARAKIAKVVGIHPQYLRDIMNGKLDPSSDLEGRLQQLAAEIQTAEKSEK